MNKIFLNQLGFERNSYLCTRNDIVQRYYLPTALAYVHPQYSYWKHEADALLSCKLKAGNLKAENKTEYDGSRIYVGLPSHCLSLRFFPAPELEDVGYTSPRSCLLNFKTLCSSNLRRIRNVACEGRIKLRPCFL